MNFTIPEKVPVLYGTNVIRKVPSHENELFRLYWITITQFHHSNSFLRLYIVALMYSRHEATAAIGIVGL